MEMEMKKNKNAMDDAALEEELRKLAVRLPEPEMELPVSPVMEARRKRSSLWMTMIRAAVFAAAVFIVGGGTALAASDSLRQIVIRFFSEDTVEELPLEQLKDTKADLDAPITVGDVTILKDQVLDSHFTVTYLTSPYYLDTIRSPSGNLLFYSQDGEGERRTYYQFQDGSLKVQHPEACQAEGRIKLKDLPGVMSYSGDVSYSQVHLPEMSFSIAWQQYGEEVILLDDGEGRFDIGSKFGGDKDGEPITGVYDGSFDAAAFPGDREQIQIFFLYDTQSTGYQYPFLFDIRTGEIQDPLAEVDLSAYACITDLCISEDKKTATAYAGASHEEQTKIMIDLRTGEVREAQEEGQALDPPVPDHYFSVQTGDHTVFYTTGTEEHMDGYIYDAAEDETTEIFSDVAWGYEWEYGFAEKYVESIGAGYAAYYIETENKVYLLDLGSGKKQLLEGVPADHDVLFSWNEQQSILAISWYTKDGTDCLAFYVPELDCAQYFDRADTEAVHKVSYSWYGEYGYLIQEVSEDRDQWYLSLYQYTPEKTTPLP